MASPAYLGTYRSRMAQFFFLDVPRSTAKTLVKQRKTLSGGICDALDQKWKLEARVGFEPTNDGFADHSLRPLGYRASVCYAQILCPELCPTRPIFAYCPLTSPLQPIETSQLPSLRGILQTSPLGLLGTAPKL